MRLFPELTPEGEFQALRDAGYTGTLNDMQYAACKDQSLSGALADMIKRHSGQLFSTDLEYGYLLKNVSGAAGTVTGYGLGTSNGNTVDTSTGKITIDSAGNYLVFSQSFPLGGTPSNVQYLHRIYLNGGDAGVGGNSFGNFFHGYSMHGSVVQTLAEADELTLVVTNDSHDISTAFGAIRIPDTWTWCDAASDVSQPANTLMTTSWTERYDSGGIYDAVTNTVTIPEDGWYLVIGGSEHTTATHALGGPELFINGVMNTEDTQWYTSGTSPHTLKNWGTNPVLLELSASDTLTLKAGGTAQIFPRFQVFKIPTEAVYWSGSHTGSFSSPSATATITGWTERIDKENAFDPSTGLFTVPTDGHYWVLGHGQAWNNGSTETQFNISTSIGTAYSRGYEAFAHRQSNACQFISSFTEGQTISFSGMGQAFESINGAIIRIK